MGKENLKNPLNYNSSPFKPLIKRDDGNNDDTKDLKCPKVEDDSFHK